MSETSALNLSGFVLSFNTVQYSVVVKLVASSGRKEMVSNLITIRYVRLLYDYVM